MTEEKKLCTVCAKIQSEGIGLHTVILTCDVIWTTRFCRAVGRVGVTLRAGRLGEGRWSGRGGEGGAGKGREGVWVDGVLGHQRLVVKGGVPELCQ